MPLVAGLVRRERSCDTRYLQNDRCRTLEAVLHGRAWVRAPASQVPREGLHVFYYVPMQHEGGRRYPRPNPMLVITRLARIPVSLVSQQPDDFADSGV